VTKKDYIALAAALVEAKKEVGASKTVHGAYVRALCNVLKADNPRFDRERFDAAAEAA
jgi:hypothetical protein